MAAAIALSGRGRGRTAPNPNVGCVIVRDGRVIGRGWTQPGGRPHAEAAALDSCDAAGAEVYVSLEPCAHDSDRGPACAALLAAAGPRRVVIAARDPDPRTDGRGIAALEAAGIAVETGLLADEAARAMAGFFVRQAQGRPHVTLKLAMSIDGRIALETGESQWITGEDARRHAHLERARHEAIVVGSGTVRADTPRLTVRLPGLEERSPRRAVLGRDAAWAESLESDWIHLSRPEAIADLEAVDHVLVEGGAGAAAAFLAADLVDRLLVYRAPIVIGSGLPAVGDIGLDRLADAHLRWRRTDSRTLGKDRLEVYERV